jgi:hypothetical protein
MDRQFPKLSKRDCKRGADLEFEFVLMGQDFVTMQKEWDQFKEKLNKWVQFIELREPQNLVGENEVEVAFE